jgi:hypothetical protein
VVGVGKVMTLFDIETRSQISANLVSNRDPPSDEAMGIRADSRPHR